ncbi:MAG: DNA primase [Bacteroidetes bacterium]|nr:DNA primase [Bacteroidota bacterium]
MGLSQQTIENVKSQIDILDVIGDFVSLKKVGQSYRALSPFTNERTPSFFVSPAKGIFKCFSTGKGGDAISFLMEHEGWSYPETIKYLANKYGIEIIEDEYTDEQILHQNERDSLYIAMNFAKDYYKHNLLHTDEGKNIGLSYFKERGFNDNTLDIFELGYSLDQWDHFLKYALEKGYQQDIIEKAGLVIKKEGSSQNGGRGIYDRFRGRAIFPIHNLSGKVIAFGARVLKNNSKQPKYINSPETDIYYKGKNLYGLYQAKQSVRQQDNVYLVEGYTDVMSLVQSGIHNVVASSGTSLSDDQIRLLRRFTQNVTVVFDGDQAGIKASLRGIDMILSGDLNVRTVLLPEGEDPDSYSKKLGPPAFLKYLEQEIQDFITFKTGLYAEEAAKDPLKKAEAIREVIESISRIPDPIKRTVYIKQCSEQLDIEESVLVAEQNKILLKRKSGKRDYDVISDIIEEKPVARQSYKNWDEKEIVALQEKESIRLLLSYGYNEIEEKHHLYDYLLEELEEVEFSTPVYKEILALFKKELAQGRVIDAMYILQHGTENMKSEVIDFEANSERYQVSSNWQKKFNIYVPEEQEILKQVTFTNILRLKFRVIRKLIKQNLQDLKNAPLDKQQKFQKIHANLKKSEMEFAKLLGNVAV